MKVRDVFFVDNQMLLVTYKRERSWSYTYIIPYTVDAGDPAKWKEGSSIYLAYDCVANCALSADGSRLAMAFLSRKVKVFCTESWDTIYSTPEELTSDMNNPVSALAFSPDNATLVYATMHGHGNALALPPTYSPSACRASNIATKGLLLILLALVTIVYLNAVGGMEATEDLSQDLSHDEL